MDEGELTTIDSSGSGFVLDDNHHIVTNAHVIGEGKKIVVITHQNQEYVANLIAKDDKTDIAVLEAPNYTAPVLPENNNSLSAGDGVFAIGSPFSLGHSTTLGIISAVERFLPNYPYLHFLQIDAAINPGNSGGALFNLNGELIGMTSTYFSRQGGYTNIAFAIPIKEVRRISEKLIHKKKIERGYLGVELLISERISRKLGYKSSLLITQIDPASPAAGAELNTGDLIIALNNIEINDGGEIHRYLEQSTPDQNVTLTILRDNEKKNVTLKLGQIPVHKNELTNIASADAAEKLGLVLRENTSSIEVLLSYSLAKMVGINTNDTILEINGYNVKTIQEFNLQLNKLKETDIALLKIKRNETLLRVPFGSKTALKGYTTRN
ncbi:MAG: trypsin-like peptidase domain-containing protein [Sulfuricurvum sp.]|nr:trypsin-like peptidase domain-containing protein [Sulfuricurvum sp.]